MALRFCYLPNPGRRKRYLKAQPCQPIDLTITKSPTRKTGSKMPTVNVEADSWSVILSAKYKMLVVGWMTAISATLGSGESVHAQQPAKSGAVRQFEVFVSGTNGYHTYRIPAIVTTRDNTLVAFCEGRKSGRGDSGNIDLLVSRSKDQGRTWSPASVIWDDQDNTCGNPCPVVDQGTGTIWLLMTWNLGSDDQNEIMDGTSGEIRHVYVTNSKDDGENWSVPRKITNQVRRPHWRWYATGPGNAIQLARGAYKGRLLIPANHSDHSDPNVHPYRSHVFWSDDHGQSWQLGGVHEDRTNESAVVELTDGSILQSMRSYHGKHNRAMAISRDGGQTWGPVYLDDAIQTPVCQGNILRYSWPEDEDSGGKSRILFSSPSGSGRTHLKVLMSVDEGKTWPVGRVLYDGGSAYSNLVALPDGQAGVLYEKDNYESISFAAFSLGWLHDDLQ